jgi:hypothetical protein
LPLSFRPRRRFFLLCQFLLLRHRKRARRPRRKLVGIVVEPFRQAPIGQGVLGRSAALLAAQVGERLAAFALEIRDARRIDFQIDRLAHDETEHQAVDEQAGAGEHAPNGDRAERREQVAEEIGVHADDPSRPLCQKRVRPL